MAKFKQFVTFYCGSVNTQKGGFRNDKKSVTFYSNLAHQNFQFYSYRHLQVEHLTFSGKKKVISIIIKMVSLFNHKREMTH